MASLYAFLWFTPSSGPYQTNDIARHGNISSRIRTLFFPVAEGKIGFAFPFFSRVHPVPARSLRLVYKSVSQGEREETSGLSDHTSYMGGKREKTSSEESTLTTLLEFSNKNQTAMSKFALLGKNEKDYANAFNSAMIVRLRFQSELKIC